MAPRGSMWGILLTGAWGLLLLALLLPSAGATTTYVMVGRVGWFSVYINYFRTFASAFSINVTLYKGYYSVSFYLRNGIWGPISSYFGNVYFAVFYNTSYYDAEAKVFVLAVTVCSTANYDTGLVRAVIDYENYTSPAFYYINKTTYIGKVEYGGITFPYCHLIRIVVGVIGYVYRNASAPAPPTVSVSLPSVNLTSISVNFSSSISVSLGTGIETPCTCEEWHYIILNGTVPAWLYFTASIGNPRTIVWLGIRRGYNATFCEAHFALSSVPPDADDPVPEPLLDIVVQPRPYYDFVNEWGRGWKAAGEKQLQSGDYYYYVALYLPNCTVIVIPSASTINVPDALENIPFVLRPIVRALLYVVDSIRSGLWSLLPPQARTFLEATGKIVGALFSTFLQLLPYVPLFLLAYILAIADNPVEGFWWLLEQVRRLIKTLIEILKP